MQPLPEPRFLTDPKALASAAGGMRQPLPLEPLFHTRVISGGAWSPDGRHVVFSANIGGRLNLWLVAAGGGWPRQLTIADDRHTSAAWSPDGRWIAFTADREGDEQWDIYLVSPRTGEIVNLTRTPESSEEGPVWSPDGRWLAFSAKPRDGSSYEIEVLDVTSGARRAVTRETAAAWSHYTPLWSPDGRRLAWTRQHATGRDGDVYLADLETGAMRNLTPHEGESVFAAADWSPDGARLLIESNAGNGFDNVALLAIADGRRAWLTEERWDFAAGGFSRDGAWASWQANVDGETVIGLTELASGQRRILPLPEGVNWLAGAESSFSPDGRELLFSHTGARGPGDLWVCSLADGATQQRTESWVGGLSGDAMTAPARVRYRSRDGFEISAWVYAPGGCARNGSHPGVVYIHGGPAAQSMNSFNRAIQYLASRGYFVIAPNYRGSTGYGKAFHDANRFDLGGGDLADVLAAADWLEATGYMAAGRLAVMGGSYGGYLTAMALTQAPERWAAGVAIVPFVNWFTEIEHEDPLLRQYDLATMGDPQENRKLYAERSPLFFADRIRAPMLVLAGRHDPRCPPAEAEQFAAAVRARGGVAELKIYDGEGHGFARRENQVDAYGRVGAFLDRYVARRS